MKYLVLGDIHNEYKMFMDAVLYAREKNLSIISVGDVVDYGKHAKSTVHLARTIAVAEGARFIEGNHDNKIARYLKGNDVTISHGMKDTIADLESDNVMKENFEYLHSNMKSYIEIGNTYMTHGALAKDFWTGDVSSDKAKRAFLYGEVDSSLPMMEFRGNKYPHRVYDWVDHIPADKTVIVGHDRTPLLSVPHFENQENEVTHHTGALGGKVIWIDTGAGKGGHVTGAILDRDGKFIETVSFK
jgi:predicted phosphodiesterase